MLSLILINGLQPRRLPSAPFPTKMYHLHPATTLQAEDRVDLDQVLGVTVAAQEALVQTQDQDQSQDRDQGFHQLQPLLLVQQLTRYRPCFQWQETDPVTSYQILEVCLQSLIIAHILSQHQRPAGTGVTLPHQPPTLVMRKVHS